jgi:(p)ppGpp synthase/HD superfamily hydrolase
MDIQTVYQNTLKFASQKHTAQGQTITDSKLPYTVHICNVTMELFIAAYSTDFNTALAVQVGLLHDTLEDTDTTFDELLNTFGSEVAQGVLALTKNLNLPKETQMMDSLQRIKQCSKEIWAVKLADRITNLQIPPQSWTDEKKEKYWHEAKIILNILQGGNSYLENRLANKIIAYQAYFMN